MCIRDSYNDYVGRIAVGRIDRGTMKTNSEVELCDYHDGDLHKKSKITAIYEFDGLKRKPVETAKAGDIVAFSGIEGVNIGNTICAPGAIEPIPFVKISEPTVETVSYTHLDVYKRQKIYRARHTI